MHFLAWYREASCLLLDGSRKYAIMIGLKAHNNIANTVYEVTEFSNFHLVYKRSRDQVQMTGNAKSNKQVRFQKDCRKSRIGIAYEIHSLTIAEY